MKCLECHNELDLVGVFWSHEQKTECSVSIVPMITRQIPGDTKVLKCASCARRSVLFTQPDFAGTLLWTCENCLGKEPL